MGRTLLLAGRPCLSQASWSALLRFAFALSDVARLGVTVLATFAVTKVARLPGRNLATLGHAKHSSEENFVLEHLGKYFEGR